MDLKCRATSCILSLYLHVSRQHFIWISLPSPILSLFFCLCKQLQRPYKHSWIPLHDVLEDWFLYPPSATSLFALKINCQVVFSEGFSTLSPCKLYGLLLLRQITAEENHCYEYWCSNIHSLVLRAKSKQLFRNVVLKETKVAIMWFTAYFCFIAWPVYFLYTWWYLRVLRRICGYNIMCTLEHRMSLITLIKTVATFN